MEMDDISQTFAALADPTRRAILARLSDGEATVSELAAPFDISQPAITRHLQVLEKAQLISRTRVRQQRPARLDPQGFARAGEWIAHYGALWEGRLDRLENYLAGMQKQGGTDE